MKIYEKYLIEGNSTDYKKLTQDIQRMKKTLIDKWKRSGFENFGQKEVRKLEDKYDIIDSEIAKLINDFDEWCMTYTGK
jgi:uncharacterized protein YukE